VRNKVKHQAGGKGREKSLTRFQWEKKGTASVMHPEGGERRDGPSIEKGGKKKAQDDLKIPEKEKKPVQQCRGEGRRGKDDPKKEKKEG